MMVIRGSRKILCKILMLQKAASMGLVGLYLLNQLKDIITNRSVSVYRDDSLAFVHKYSGPQMDRLRKNITDFFKQHGFQTTIEKNLKITDFLDIYLELESSTHTENLTTDLYTYTVNLIINLIIVILKQLPKITSERFSYLPCNEDEFINHQASIKMC